MYRDVKSNGWLVGAKVIYHTVDTLCFGCLDGFMDWIGLDFDFGKLHKPSKYIMMLFSYL